MDTPDLHDPVALAERALGCVEGTAIDEEQRRVIIFCQEHSSDGWPCHKAEELAETIRERDASIQRWHRDREEYFARLFGVTDDGRYRNDWDAAVARWRKSEHERVIDVLRPEYPDAVKTAQHRIKALA